MAVVRASTALELRKTPSPVSFTNDRRFAALAPSLGPVFLQTRECWASSRPISREYPTTSAARTAATSLFAHAASETKLPARRHWVMADASELRPPREAGNG